MAPRGSRGKGDGPTGKRQADALLDEIVAQILASTGPGSGLPGLFRDAGVLPDLVENHPITLPPPPRTPVLLTVRVDVVGAKPPIWRRLDLRGELSLAQVHEHLQAAIGWYDSHLHRFQGPGVAMWDTPYFLTDADLEEGDDVGTHEADARLDQVLRTPGDRLGYVYDFGDGWQHRLRLESTRPATPTDPDARCVGGRRAGPAEDVGGIHTWNELSDALRADPDPTRLSGELQMYAEWLPPGTAPDAFDIDEVNESLAAVTAVISLRAEPTAPVPPPADDATTTGEDSAAVIRSSAGELPGAHPALTGVVRKSHPLAARAVLRLARQAQAAPEPTAPELSETLRPWSVVLQTAGTDGIPLTKAGFMAPAACERIWHGSGLAWDYGKGNREQFTPEVAMLRQECLRAKLIRTFKGRLVLTPAGPPGRRRRGGARGRGRRQPHHRPRRLRPRRQGADPAVVGRRLAARRTGRRRGGPRVFDHRAVPLPGRGDPAAQLDGLAGERRPGRRRRAGGRVEGPHPPHGRYAVPGPLPGAADRRRSTSPGPARALPGLMPAGGAVPERRAPSPISRLPVGARTASGG
jgi:hypothetical protein